MDSINGSITEMAGYLLAHEYGKERVEKQEPLPHTRKLPPLSMNSLQKGKRLKKFAKPCIPGSVLAALMLHTETQYGVSPTLQQKIHGETLAGAGRGRARQLPACSLLHAGVTRAYLHEHSQSRTPSHASYLLYAVCHFLQGAKQSNLGPFTFEEILQAATLSYVRQEIAEFDDSSPPLQALHDVIASSPFAGFAVVVQPIHMSLAAPHFCAESSGPGSASQLWM
eukprot:scaffold90230_cov19-Tisochrysis_lutea.AAC.1